MFLLRDKIFKIVLALAWVLAPAIHAGGHLLAESRQRQVHGAQAGAGEQGLRLHASQTAERHDCEDCQSLAQAKGQVAAAPVLSVLPLALAIAPALGRITLRSIVFTPFDHRGPPVQA